MVTVLVRSRYLEYAKIPFVVDSGADLIALPIPFAQQEGIAFPRSEAARGRSGGLVGAVDHYRGSIHVRPFEEEFDWPCEFLDTPAGTPRKYGVLGRAGFARAFKACTDDKYLTLQRNYRHRPWWYRLARSLWPDWAVYHSADQPL
jgi:hypothetical protein